MYLTNSAKKQVLFDHVLEPQRFSVPRPSVSESQPLMSPRLTSSSLNSRGPTSPCIPLLVTAKFQGALSNLTINSDWNITLQLRRVETRYSLQRCNMCRRYSVVICCKRNTEITLFSKRTQLFPEK